MMASTQGNDQKYKLFFIPSGAWTLKGFGSDVEEHKEVIINILRYFTVGRLHERAKYSILIVLYVCMKPKFLLIIYGFWVLPPSLTSYITFYIRFSSYNTGSVVAVINDFKINL